MRLSKQIFYLTLGSVLLTMLVASIYFSIGLREAFMQQKLDSLNSQLHLRVQHFITQIDQLKDDIALLRRDELAKQWLLSGKTNADLEQLIEAEYHSYLITRPHYFQIRLLSLEGRELIRLDRSTHGINVTSDNELQDKSGRYYIDAAKKMVSGEVWLSPVDLNREFGDISQPETPTIRAATVLLDEHKQAIAIIIINMDLSGFLETLSQTELDSTILVVNQSGDFLVHPNAEYTFATDKGHSNRLATVYPKLNYELAFAASDKQHAIKLQSKNYIFRSQLIPHDHLTPENNIYVIHLYPERVLAQSTNSTLYAYLKYAFWLFLGITILTLVVSNRFTKRFLRLNTLVRNAAGNIKTEINIEKPEDEIDEVLLTFKNMLETIEDRERSLIDNKKQLAAYSEKLERSNRDLENFAYMASHDLQEPARKVESFSSLLLMSESSNLSQDGRELLERNMRSASQMRELINAVLALSRVERLPLQKIEISLELVLEEALEDLQDLLEESQAEVHIESLPYVHGERVQIKQLFINILNNAIKYVDTDVKPTIRIKPAIKFEDDGTTVEAQGFMIEDNAVGIAPEDRERVFIPFARLSKNVTGFGMGLALCQRIVNMHGGKISIEGLEPHGSRFIVLFPA